MQIRGVTRNRKTEHKRCQTSLNIGSIRYEEAYQKVYSSEDMNWRGHNTKTLHSSHCHEPCKCEKDLKKDQKNHITANDAVKKDVKSNENLSQHEGRGKLKIVKKCDQKSDLKGDLKTPKRHIAEGSHCHEPCKCEKDLKKDQKITYQQMMLLKKILKVR